jgi:hypothetical protein
MIKMMQLLSTILGFSPMLPHGTISGTRAKNRKRRAQRMRQIEKTLGKGSYNFRREAEHRKLVAAWKKLPKA